LYVIVYLTNTNLLVDGGADGDPDISAYQHISGPIPAGHQPVYWMGLSILHLPALW